MGLDQYLEGRKHLFSDYENPENDIMEDGFRIKERTLELGYWRKHPNLHGYIVQEFADGEDKCQDIELDADNIRQIITAIKARKLPHTEGFFFGQSDDSPRQRADDVAIWEGALDWLEAIEPPPKPKEVAAAGGMVMYEIKPEVEPLRESRYVIYRASW